MPFKLLSLTLLPPINQKPENVPIFYALHCKKFKIRLENMVAMAPEIYTFMQSDLTDVKELNLTAGMV